MSASGTDEKETRIVILKTMKIMQGRGKNKKYQRLGKLSCLLKDLQTSACLNYLKEIEKQLISYLPTLRDNTGHQTVL